MTRQINVRFTSTSVSSRGTFGKLSGWKMACAIFLLCAATTISPAQIFTTLLNFDGTNGANPDSPLVQGVDGNFYGTTPGGGAYGWGTVFKITPGRALTTLYSFCAQANCPDGGKPDAGLVLASDGNFYGTTSWGGAYVTCDSNPCGTIFRITPGGRLTTLHSFDGTDGATPNARLVQATDGNFYGTTYEWGPTEVAPSSRSAQGAFWPRCTAFVPVANALTASPRGAG